MEYLDWGIRFLVGGLAIWAIRALFIERTKRRKAGDQTLSQDEIETKIAGSLPDCDKEHGNLKEGMKTEIQHVHDLVKKDLATGSKKFDEQAKDIKAVESAVTARSGDLQALCAVLEKNGVKIGG